jgi:hypothetical protein
MNFSSLSRKKTPVHMSTQAFDALDEQAYVLSKQTGSTTRYRLALTEDKQGVQIVPVKAKVASPRALAVTRKKHDGRAQRSLTDFMQRLCKHSTSQTSEAERSQQALAAVLALPHEFDHQAVHEAIRSVSKARSRDAIAETSAKVLDCVEALSKDPHGFGPVARPVSPSCADAKQADEAVVHWCQAFDYEWQLLAKQENLAEKDDIRSLWTRLFTLQFGAQQRTAQLTPETLRDLVFNEPMAEVMRLHADMQAVMQAGRGRGASASTCSAWLSASEALIAAVAAYIQLLAVVAPGLFDLAAKRPETEPTMKQCKLPARHRDLWQNLARTMLDKACAALQPQGQLMSLLDEALSCRSQALLARETAAAEASAAHLLTRVQALPQQPALENPQAEQQQGADAAYRESMDAVEHAERRLNRLYRPPSDDSAAQSVDAALVQRLRDINTRLGGQAAIKGLSLERLWSKLIDKPIAQLHALMVDIHWASSPSALKDQTPEQQKRLLALSEQVCTQLPRLLNRMATVAGVLASEARSVLLPRHERERLLALATALLDFARALLDPAGRHMAYYQDAKDRLAGAQH